MISEKTEIKIKIKNNCFFFDKAQFNYFNINNNTNIYNDLILKKINLNFCFFKIINLFL